MDNDKLKIWLELGKWFVGSVAIVIATMIIDAGFKSRDEGLKELTLYDKYVNLIIANDNAGAKRKLAEFFATVTTSRDLRKCWNEYYKIADLEYKDYVNKDSNANTELKKLNSSKFLTSEQELQQNKLLERKIEYEKQLKTDIKIPSNFGVGVNEEKSMDKSAGLENARLWEEKGFDYLLKKDIETAISSFSKSENAYPSYHQVYEIKNYLSKQAEKSGKDISETTWKDIYKTILDKYGWGMPPLYKDEFNKLIK